MPLFPGWRSLARSLVPDDFDVPTEWRTPVFRLEALSERHNEGDHEAWMSNIPFVQATAGFAGTTWPPSEGMSLEENMQSVRRHIRHFAARVGFTYAVMPSGSDDVIGCVYLYPAADDEHDCEVRTWVRADLAVLDAPVHHAVTEWVETAWPFQAVLSHPRPRHQSVTPGRDAWA
ncbi:N-acetyltransferase [Actinomadura decatromicini]|uniref:N-acetyltransferase n=1 Tax=Actinomadura decatromicini TaxID=2604572 RepID=A0A5D3FU73_9ACTN|nr:N-acetyltransferase [Actinomadura decatromicini]TYK52397.1 N-acetyltransferase [Actinomadura decatromicini]